MFILALNVFESIFENSVENTQNKPHCHPSVVCNNSLFLMCVSLQITEILSIKCLVFTVLRPVLKPSVQNSKFCSSTLYVLFMDTCGLQLCYFVHKVYNHLRYSDWFPRTHLSTFIVKIYNLDSSLSILYDFLKGDKNFLKVLREVNEEIDIMILFTLCTCIFFSCLLLFYTD